VSYRSVNQQQVVQTYVPDMNRQSDVLNVNENLIVQHGYIL